MTPAQALFYLENAGGMGVPEIYRKMPWPLLVAPVQECAKSPNGYTDGTEQTPPSAGGKPPIREPVPFTGLVLRRGRRLSTPARLRAAFLYYLRRCGSVKEAAARARCWTTSSWMPTPRRRGRSTIAAGRSAWRPNATGRSGSIC